MDALNKKTAFTQDKSGENSADKSVNKPVNSKKGATIFFNDFFNKVLNFTTKKLHFIVTALIITVICSTVFAIYKVFPFGANTIASYDMLAQIVPFIEHFFDVFNGKSSMLYSTAIAGGADVFGTMAYCLISPFTFIFLLFGKGNVYYGVGLVLMLKLIGISFSALIFIEKNFPNIPKNVRIVYAVLYAYCGYTFVSNTYINWMDFLIYLPFVVTGYKKLVNGGSIWQFSICYALMIYTCFSLASFAMLIVFLIVVIHVLFTQQNKKDLLSKSCLAFLAAVGLSLPVMVPSLISYLSSKRSTGLFDNLFNDLNATHIYRKITYIVSDAFFLLSTLAYFIKNGVKRPIDRFLLTSGSILLIPVFIDESCNLLNFGSYLGYFLRFGFLHSFYTFYIAVTLASDYYKNKLGDIPTSKKHNLLCYALLILLSIGAIIYLCSANEIIDFIETIYQKTDKTAAYEFYELFAHALGGLEVIAPFFCVLALILILSVIFVGKKLCNVKIVAPIICCLLCAQVIFYNVALVKGNLYAPSRYDDYNAIHKLIDENENDANDYYRLKDTTDALTADVGLTTHTNSYGVFSSVVNSKNFTATDFFGYFGNGINSAKSAGGNFLGDMLLGYKYYYHRVEGDEDGSDKNDKYVSRSYLEKLDYTDRGSSVAYKNNAAFPNAFTIKSGELNLHGLNYADSLDKLYAFLGGIGQLCDRYDLQITSEYDTEITPLKDGSFKITSRIHSKDSYWFLQTDFPEKYDIKYCYDVEFDKDDCKTLEQGGYIKLNYYKYSSGVFNVTLKDLNNLLTIDDIQKYCKNCGIKVSTVYNPYDGDSEIFDLAVNNKVDYKIHNGNTFTMTISAKDDETYLFLNYVKLDGHKLTVNSKEAEFIDNSLDFMLLKLEKGQNNVVIKYASPYPKYAVFGLIAALILISLIIVILKFAKIYNTLRKVIYPCGIAVFVVVSGFFFIYPTSVFLLKAVKLLLGF